MKRTTMAAIPPTRSIGKGRRINVPQSIAEEYASDASFEATIRAGDLVLSPSEAAEARKMTAKNRVRVPPEIANQFRQGAEFLVVRDGEDIVFRAAENVDLNI